MFLTAVMGVTLFSVVPLANENVPKSLEDFLSELTDMVEDYDTSVFNLQGSGINGNEKKTNRLIVKSFMEILPDDRGAVEKAEGWNNFHILQYLSDEDTNSAFEFFSTASYVEYVEEDKYVSLAASINGSDSPNGFSGYSNNEPMSWGNSIVNSTATIERISDSHINLHNVFVAVFDGGIYTNHSYFQENQTRLLEEYDPFLEENITTFTSTDYRHGSHVTGIILNNSLSNVGVKSYRVSVPTKEKVETVLSIFATTVYKAIEDGAVAINVSLTTNYYSKSIQDAFEYAMDSNVPVVVAAGNDEDGEGFDISGVFPANSPYVITVASIDESLCRMKKSNNGINSSCFGSVVDISAPGDGINSVKVYLSGFSNDYMEMWGTSMAAPFVTAAIGTLKSINPDMTFYEIYDRITSSANKPDNWDDICPGCGAGILDFSGMLSDIILPKPEIILSENTAVITSKVSNVDIYYTVDGTEPSVNSLLYNGSISTNNVKVIKAIAAENGKITSITSTCQVQLDDIYIDVYYKISKKISFPNGWSAEKINNLNPDIATISENGKVKSIALGDAVAKITFKNNCKVVYHIHVDYHPIIRKIINFFSWLLKLFGKR